MNFNVSSVNAILSFGMPTAPHYITTCSMIAVYKNKKKRQATESQLAALNHISLTRWQVPQSCQLQISGLQDSYHLL